MESLVQLQSVDLKKEARRISPDLLFPLVKCSNSFIPWQLTEFPTLQIFELTILTFSRQNLLFSLETRHEMWITSWNHGSS